MLFRIPVAVIINPITPAFVNHSIAVIINFVIGITWAFKKFISKVTGRASGNIADSVFVPAINHVNVPVKIRQIILPVRWTAYMWISPHAKHDFIQVFITFIRDLINEKNNIFRQWVGPLVITAFYLNPQSFMCGVVRKRVVFEFFIGAIIHNKEGFHI